MINKIKPITLEINKDTWDSFKGLVPRSETLNDKIVKLIDDYVKGELAGGKVSIVSLSPTSKPPVGPYFLTAKKRLMCKKHRLAYNSGKCPKCELEKR